jgi:hypothetical protein
LRWYTNQQGAAPAKRQIPAAGRRGSCWRSASFARGGPVVTQSFAPVGGTGVVTVFQGADVMADLLGSGRRVGLRLVALTVLGVFAWGLPTASAIPAFARKYRTSCQTCHTVFPKLNAFGVAFRLQGYRMPQETEDMVKEKPVALGAPAYKKLWPQAVWPGEIASAVPLAINAKFAYVNVSTLNPDGTVTRSNNDLQFPQEVNIFGAGTLGDHISYLTEITFAVNPDSSVSTDL